MQIRLFCRHVRFAGVLHSGVRTHLLKDTALTSAGHGGIRSIMDDMTLLSTEAEGVNDTIPVRTQIDKWLVATHKL